MERPKYIRGLECISETARNFESKCNLYQRKQKEKNDCQATIDSIKYEIEELSSKALLIDDIKRDSLAMVEETYNNEMEDANRKYKASVDKIDEDEKRDSEVCLSIQNDFNNRIHDAHKKVDDIEVEINENLRMAEEARRTVDKLEKQISNPTLEENQIELCAIHIASEYDNIVNNTDFIRDYRDLRGASPEEAQKKFQLLSAKRIKKIARKMNVGAYILSPDESKGLPIMEILMMAATTLWIVVKGIFQGIGLLYKPIRRFHKTTHKIIYVTVATLLLFLLLSSISSRFGDGIVSVLFIVFIVIVATFFGMILFNVIKYSNKAFRKEQNLEYYTVGYFFTYAKHDILYKIAREYYTELKKKNPTELESILQSTFETLQSQKQMAIDELSVCEKRLDGSKSKMVSIEEQFEKEKDALEQQCKERIDSAVKSLREERETKRKLAKDELKQSIELITSKRENAINSAEKNAIETIERRKQDIERANENLAHEKEKLQSIVDELSVICVEVDNICKENNDMAAKYKEFDIDAIDNRMKNDKLPETLVAGLSKKKRKNLQSANEQIIYEPVKLQHNNKPIIITYNATDDESTSVTESYYSFIDSLIADTLAKMYIGGFRYVLVDSQGNKSGIMKNMNACRSSFEVLEKAGCLKVCTESSNKCFEDIIREQETQLSSRSIEEVNEANKNLDNMVRYTFLCIRIYSKKSSDFTLGDFRKRIDSSLNNGIIPIIIMSQSYFAEKKADLEGTIKELCNNRYYMLDVNQKEEIKVVNL